MKNALLSNGIVSGYQIDKKAHLLAMYRHTTSTYCGGCLISREDPIMLISPTRHAWAVRLTFNPEYRFTWHGWSVDDNVSDVEESQVVIDNISWTWQVKNAIIKIIIDLLKFYHTP